MPRKAKQQKQTFTVTLTPTEDGIGFGIVSTPSVPGNLEGKEFEALIQAAKAYGLALLEKRG